MIVIGVNQPRLFPYLRYWRLAARTDIFNLGVYDPFTVKYHHRCLVGSDNANEWFRLPLMGRAKDLAKDKVPINQVRLDTEGMLELMEMFRHVHRNDRFYDDTQYILEKLLNHGMLWTLCLDTMEAIKQLLGLDNFVFSIGRKSSFWGSVPETTTSRLASQTSVYRENCMYLAGSASKDYLDIDKYEKLTNHVVQLYDDKADLGKYSTVNILSVISRIGVKATRELILK